MNEVIKKVYYTAIGKRTNNEDSFLISENNFFMVCDGVGGAEKGEIASLLLVSEFKNVFETDLSTSPEIALRSAEKKMTEHISNHPESMGMATTLTFSKLTNEGILVAWIGDSRIYQFRKGKIIFQTTDHSWVNDALRVGMISPEEAVNHPKSNIITRAVQGEHKPVEIDMELVNDIQNGDYIFHCSDGVLEAWSNEELEYLFSTQSSLEEIIKLIEQKCEEISRDNNTAILYQLKSDNKQSINQDIKTTEVFEEEIVEAIPIDVNQFQNTKSNLNAESYNNYSNSNKFKFNKLLFLVTLLVIGIVIFYKWNSSNDVNEKLNKTESENILNSSKKGKDNIEKNVSVKKKVNIEQDQQSFKNSKDSISGGLKMSNSQEVKLEETYKDIKEVNSQSEQKNQLNDNKNVTSSDKKEKASSFIPKNLKSKSTKVK
jgi:serine/threonine protein phosphatase PrpC